MFTDEIQPIIDEIPLAVLDELRGKRILMTGGLGFLGRYILCLTKALNAQDVGDPIEVIAVDNMLTAGQLGTAMFKQHFENDPYIQLRHHDVTKPVDWPGEAGRLHYVLSMAGIASPPWYKRYPLECIDVTVQGTRHMLELARRHSAKVLYFSSSEVVGTAEVIPTPEYYVGRIDCRGERACYDVAKMLGETLTTIYHGWGVEAVTVRPYNVVGPGMQQTDYRVFPSMATQIVKGKGIEVYGSGIQTRTFCDIRDAIPGILTLLVCGESGEVYNLGSQQPEVTMQELADTFTAAAKALKIDTVDPVAITPPVAYTDEPRRRRASVDKLIALGYRPVCNSVYATVLRFLRWAAEHYE